MLRACLFACVLAFALPGHVTDDRKALLLRQSEPDASTETEGPAEAEESAEAGESAEAKEGEEEGSGAPSTIRYEKSRGESTAERVTPVHESEKEEGEKGEKGEEGGEGEEKEGETGPVVAVLMMSGILFTPVVLEFATAGGIRQKLTLRMIEAFLTIFVAVMWFSAFDKFLHVANLEGHHIVIAGILNMCLLFMLATIVSWGFRRSDIALSIFLACGAHFVGFSACHAAGHVHMHYFPGPNQSWIFLLVTVAAAMVLCLGLFGFRKVMGYTKQRNYEEAYGDFENDVIALTISYSTANVVKFLAVAEVNHFNNAHKAPSGEEEFLQLRREEGEEHHTTTQRLIMFGFAVVTLGLSMVVPEAKESASTFTKKALDITQGALMMCGAWGFLLAFHWEFYEVVFPDVTEESDFAVFAAVIFAVALTAVALAVIQILSSAGVKSTSVVARCIPIAVALGAAFAWEEAFDLGVEIMVDRYQFFPKSQGLGVHLTLAITSVLTLIPTYAKHIKPQLLE
jgi:hypothetical protein